MVASITELLWNPDYLLHRIEPDADRLVFLPTNRQLLSAATFIDGRTEIASGPPVIWRLSDALQTIDPPTAGRSRFIFHISFCGSTLLARILSQPGRNLVLREPNCLVDLADWKAKLQRRSQSDERLEFLVKFACAALQARRQPDEAVTIKPSSWVNNLLPEIIGAGRETLALFVTTGIEAFITAVFRGGRDRLAFTARLAEHLAGGSPADEALLAKALRLARDPLHRAANLAALAHHLQIRRFQDAMAARGWGASRLISLRTLTESPYAASALANFSLDLGLSLQEMAQRIENEIQRHSKDRGANFVLGSQLAADSQVVDRYGSKIDAALAWAEECLPCAGRLTESPHLQTPPGRRDRALIPPVYRRQADAVAHFR